VKGPQFLDQTIRYSNSTVHLRVRKAMISSRPTKNSDRFRQRLSTE
jgi:hypothetical protein